MLGYTHTGSSNVFIFFDGDDILNLREEKIIGHYINTAHSDETGKLEAVIDDQTCRSKMQQVATTIEANGGVVSFMVITMMQRVYNSLVERGNYADHQGFRHVHLIDIKREMNPSLLSNYDYLRCCVRKV